MSNCYNGYMVNNNNNRALNSSKGPSLYGLNPHSDTNFDSTTARHELVAAWEPEHEGGKAAVVRLHSAVSMDDIIWIWFNNIGFIVLIKVWSAKNIYFFSLDKYST